MHNKLWIADNAAAIVGGRNLGDEYFDASGEVNFSDLDVLAAGPVVRDISRSFDDYWNSEWSVPIEAFVAEPPGPERLAGLERALETRLQTFRDTDYARVLRETRLGLQLRSGQLPLIAAHASALYDKPEKHSGSAPDASGRQVFTSRMRPIVEAAQREIIMISPYFIPNEEGIGVLSALARRGVRVRILTNSLASTDVPVAHAAYARLRERLLAAGVELYEMRPEPRDFTRGRRLAASSGASLHAKTIVVDRLHMVVGSMNLDPRSRLYNTEVAVLLESAPLGTRLGTLFDEAVQPAHAFRVALAGAGQEHPPLIWTTEENGKEVRYESEPLAGFWQRFFATFFGALISEDLL